LHGPGKRKSAGIASNPTPEDVTVRNIFKPRTAHRSSITIPSALSKEVTSNKGTGPHVPDQRTSGETAHGYPSRPKKPDNTHSLFGHPVPKLSERTEILNTLTQRSSQVDLPDRTCNTRHNVEFTLSEPDTNVPSQPEECSSPVMFCSSFVPKNVESRAFRKRPLIIGTWKLEIPETPDAIPTRDAPIPSSLELAKSTSQSNIPISTADITSAPQHKPSQSPAKPAATYARQDAPSGVYIDLQEPIEPVLSPHATLATKGHILVPTPDQAHKKNHHQDEPHVQRSPVDSQGEEISEPILAKPTALKKVELLDVMSEAEQLLTPRLSPAKESMASEDYPGPLGALLASTKTQVQTGNESSPMHEAQQEDAVGEYEGEGVTQESRHDDAAGKSARVRTSTLERSQPASATPESSAAPNTTRMLSRPDASTTTNLENIATLKTDKRYTNRELARIALVAANGSGMTALQVVDWVAQRFPYKQKGQGRWEKSLKSILSLKDEYRGDQPAKRVPESSKLYSFATATIRARFEKEYSAYRAYRAQPVFAAKQPSQKLPQDRRESSVEPTTSMSAGAVKAGKAIKSAPLRRTQTSVPMKPDASLGASSAASALKAIQDDKPEIPLGRQQETPGADDSLVPDATTTNTTSKDEPLWNPFDGPTAELSESEIAFANNLLQSGRQSSFFKLTPQPQKPSIDTMTPEEKAAKIAEIQARPSRKKFFGSEHRLAYVRRYGRQDIQDESDGAWIPPPKNPKTAREKDVVMDDGGDTRTLREVFNLPANAIPMNDGQELAFRDGTLVKGRLPRPRNVYRVGKMFGGELTSKLS
jgi:hypothetical protein